MHPETGVPVNPTMMMMRGPPVQPTMMKDWTGTSKSGFAPPVSEGDAESLLCAHRSLAGKLARASAAAKLVACCAERAEASRSKAVLAFMARVLSVTTRASCNYASTSCPRSWILFWLAALARSGVSCESPES